MWLTELVQPILFILKWLCRFVLLFYFLRVMVIIFFGKTISDSRRLQEALAMAYTLVAAWLILQSTNAILPFVQNIINSVVLVSMPTTIINFVLVICSGLVCTAFICNFSRSLWMLKSLDHAVFESVPKWEKLSAISTSKKIFEFATRTVAALLFIGIELQLEKLSTSSSRGDVTSLAIGEAPQNCLAAAGWYGFFLYVCFFS